MSLWQIAFKNVWQNRNRYLAYLASSAFSVMVFFLYSALICHPQLQGGYYQAQNAIRGMRAAAIVIAVFSFLFLLYSNSAFTRSRMKEFGLLSLLGVSRSQLVRIILWESLVIALVAIVAGLGAGLLFLKLFFMVVSVLLQLPQQVPFYAGLPVWIQTVSVFGAFYLLVSLTSLRGVMRRNIIELVRASRQPKETPTFSHWKTALGVVLVVGGYAWASVPHPAVVVLGIIPVTLLVCVGTYLLLREGSVALFTMLHRREKFFFRPGPFLSVSQLVYKMQDNYRVLSAVAILVAVILSAVGTVFSLYASSRLNAIGNYPHAFQLIQKGVANSANAVAQVEAVLRKHGVTGMQYYDVTTMEVKHDGKYPWVILVPYSFYSTVPRTKGNPLGLGQVDEVILISPTPAQGSDLRAALAVPDHLIVNGQQIPVTRLADHGSRILNLGGTQAQTLVISDELMDNLLQQVPAQNHIHLATWSGANWRTKEAKEAAIELRSLYPRSGQQIYFSATVENYQATLSLMGMLLFIGVFVSLVFFAACCSLLYFRLFTEIDDDRRYFHQLQQVGVSQSELQRLALSQAATLFFVPFVVGFVHTTFAMKALGTLIMGNAISIGWAVSLGYLILLGIYFGITYSFYWHTLRNSLQGTQRVAIG